MRITYKGLAALAIALTELALLPILLDIGEGSGIGIITLLFYAFLVGSATALAVSYASDRMKGLVGILRSGRLLVIIVAAGLLNDVISQLLLGTGTAGTNPIVAATIFRSWVIMSALLVPLALRQRVTRVQMLAILIGFLGVYLLATNGSLLSINQAELPFIAILLASALCTVYPNLAMKRYNVDTVGAIAIFNLASLACIVALAAVTGTDLIVPLSATTALVAIFLGVATYGIGTSLYYYALKAFGPLFVGNSILVVPFLTIVLSFALLGTQVYPYYLVAAGLLSLGVVVQRRFSRAPEYIKRRSGTRIPLFDVTSAFVNNRGETVSGYLSGNRRAFAIRLDGDAESAGGYKELFDRYGCLAFTSSDAHPEVMSEELDYVNEIMGARPADTVLIGMGRADRLEDSFTEFADASSKGGTGEEVLS